MKAAFLKDVLEDIKPSKQDDKDEKELAAYCIKKLQATSNEFVAVLVGSVAKGTYLRQGTDIDIFLLFDREKNKDRFEALIKRAVEKAFPNERYEISYAEHPYVKLYYRGRKIDIVPAYKIKDINDMGSAVDRSLLHTRYVIKKLSKDMIKEVLLLKKFLKGNEMYGAQIKYEGVSGYLCELLILKYKTFLNTIKNAHLWKEGMIIQLETKVNYKKKDLEQLRKRFNAPLIFIDPTDKNRNVAAAFSMENFRMFKKLAKKFLANPSRKFFNDPKTFEEKISKAGGRHKAKVCVISFKKPRINEDILWGQVKRFCRQLEAYLSSKDFVIKGLFTDIEEHGQLVKIALILKEDILGNKKILIGPDKKRKQNVEEFKKAHRGSKIFFENEKACAVAPRTIITLNDAIDRFLSKGINIKHLSEIKKTLKVEKIWIMEKTTARDVLNVKN